MAIGAQDVKAGGAFVEMRLKDLVSGGLNKLGQTLKAFGGLVMGVGAGIFALGGGIAAALGTAVKMVVDFAGDIQDAADQLGEPASRLAAMKGVAEDSSVEFEALVKAMFEFQRAGLGGSDAFIDTIDQLAKMEDKVKANNMAVELFGKGGRKLLGMARATAGGLRELVAEAERLGLSSDDIAAADAFGDALAHLGRQAKLAAMHIGAELVKALTPFLSKINAGMRDVVTFAKDARGAITWAANLLKGIGGSLWEYVGATFNRIRESWNGVVEALRSGDLVLAGKIAFTALSIEALRAMKFIGEKWNELVQEQMQIGGLSIGEQVTTFLGGLSAAGMAAIGTDPTPFMDALAQDILADRRQRVRVTTFDKDIERIQRELDRLLGQVPQRSSAGLMWGGPLAWALGRAMAGGKAGSGPAALSLGDVRGTFAGGAAASRALGVNDKFTDRLLKANEEQVDLLKRIDRKLKVAE